MRKSVEVDAGDAAIDIELGLEVVGVLHGRHIAVDVDLAVRAFGDHHEADGAAAATDHDVAEVFVFVGPELSDVDIGNQVPDPAIELDQIDVQPAIVVGDRNRRGLRAAIAIGDRQGVGRTVVFPVDVDATPCHLESERDRSIGERLRAAPARFAVVGQGVADSGQGTAVEGPFEPGQALGFVTGGRDLEIPVPPGSSEIVGCKDVRPGRVGEGVEQFLSLPAGFGDVAAIEVEIRAVGESGSEVLPRRGVATGVIRVDPIVSESKATFAAVGND